MIPGIKDAQDQNGNKPWDYKERSGYDPSWDSMQEPANVNGELLRLGTGKKHAVIQGMEKATITYPAFLFNQISVHNRYLTDRTTKTVKSDVDPDPECFPKRRSDPGRAFTNGFFVNIRGAVCQCQSTPAFSWVVPELDLSSSLLRLRPAPVVKGIVHGCFQSNLLLIVQTVKDRKTTGDEF